MVTLAIGTKAKCRLRRAMPSLSAKRKTYTRTDMSSSHFDWIRVPSPRMSIEGNGSGRGEVNGHADHHARRALCNAACFRRPRTGPERAGGDVQNARALKLIPQLCDLGDKRIAEIDAAGIDMQIVSVTGPRVEQLDGAEATALAAETKDLSRARSRSIRRASAALRRCRPRCRTRITRVRAEQIFALISAGATMHTPTEVIA